MFPKKLLEKWLKVWEILCLSYRDSHVKGKRFHNSFHMKNCEIFTSIFSRERRLWKHFAFTIFTWKFNSENFTCEIFTTNPGWYDVLVPNLDQYIVIYHDKQHPKRYVKDMQIGVTICPFIVINFLSWYAFNVTQLYCRRKTHSRCHWSFEHCITRLCIAR